VSLGAGPMYVALIQTASALPFFFLALPAGALGDIVNRPSSSRQSTGSSVCGGGTGPCGGACSTTPRRAVGMWKSFSCPRGLSTSDSTTGSRWPIGHSRPVSQGPCAATRKPATSSPLHPGTHQASAARQCGVNGDVPCNRLLRFGRDDGPHDRRFVARELPEHLHTQRQDEREAEISLHPADRDAYEVAALVQHAAA
jgi:hypothetical protein